MTDEHTNLPLDNLPFPALVVGADGVIAASNGVLERKLGMSGETFASRPLGAALDSRSRARIAPLVAEGVTKAACWELTFVSDGDAILHGEFQVVPHGDRFWLLGVQRSDEVTRLHEEMFSINAELTDRDRELARSNRELQTAFKHAQTQRDEIAHQSEELQEQAAALEEQHASLEAAHRRAEAQADEYARLSTQLTRVNEELEERARALQEATQAKSRFLATMSHELRTPLNAVIGYAGLLRDGVYGGLRDQQSRAVLAIVRRARDLQLLIDDVLDLSKIEAGKMLLHVEDVDPGSVLHEVEETISPLAHAKALEIKTHNTVHRPVTVDRAKYKQIVLNLASNAVKFTPHAGTVEIGIRMGEGDRFVTVVRDTGIGIAGENLARIFDVFQQVEDTTARRFQGTGLGLSIARRLAEMMGGELTVQSELGRGSEFALSLPVHADAAEAPPVPEPLDDVDSLPHDAPVVLAIDDDPEVIGLLRDSLGPAGFHVVGALNGQRGIELARLVHPFAITLDIMMPDKDGWQVLKEIKAEPDLCDIPVIIMSIVSERALGFSLGVTDYLVKPVDRSVLLGVLDRLRRAPALRTAVVVEDDPDAQALMGDLLASLNFEVLAAGDGTEAIAMLAKEPPAFLFLSLTLPSQDVSDILAAMSADPRLERTRTVILAQHTTAAEQLEWIRRATSAVVLRSTGRPDELLRQLRALLADLTPSTVTRAE